VEDMRFEGWTFLTQTQLFTVMSEPRTGMFTFAIFNAVLRHRAEVLDGISMGLQRVGGGSPAAMGCLMERVGQLSGDATADVRRLKEEFDGVLQIPGSHRLVQELLAADLVDQINLMVFPVILGTGKKAFEEAPERRKRRIVKPPQAQSERQQIKECIISRQQNADLQEHQSRDTSDPPFARKEQ